MTAEIQELISMYLQPNSDIRATEMNEICTKIATEIDSKLVGTEFLGSIIPSATPTGTGTAFWIAAQNGTYTNFGGVVVAANSFAVISRDALGAFSISQTDFDISSKVNVSDVVNNLTSTETTKPASANSVRLTNEKFIDYIKNPYFEKVATDTIRLNAFKKIQFTKGVLNPSWRYKIDGLQRNVNGNWLIVISKTNGVDAQPAFVLISAVAPTTDLQTIDIAPYTDVAGLIEIGVARVTIDWSKIPNGYDGGAVGTTADLNSFLFFEKTEYYTKNESDSSYVKNIVFDETATNELRKVAILDIKYDNKLKHNDWKYFVDFIKKDTIANDFRLYISRDNSAGIREPAFGYLGTANTGLQFVKLSPLVDEKVSLVVLIDWSKIPEGYADGSMGFTSLLNKDLYTFPNDFNALDKHRLIYNKYIYNGKKPLYFGDSIIALLYWRQIFNGKILVDGEYNFAVSGAKITSPVGYVYTGVSAQGVSSVDQSINCLENQVRFFIDTATVEPAFCFIPIGINDQNSTIVTDADFESQFTVTLESTDRKTYAGALRYAFQKLKTAFPNIKIVFGTPLQSANQDISFTREKSYLMKRIAERLGTPVIDGFANSGIFSGRETLNGAGAYLYDGIHPNTDGCNLLAEFYADELFRFL